ncbi:MAG: nucleoside-diphosphate kinase [Firmicutes bacterium]|nr:nucleoside-diphosphate kinase [Bacillota bacterium]
MERTLIIIKPDGVERGLIGEVVSRFERAGLKVVAMRMLRMTGDLAGRHYHVHAAKPFYAGLVEYITSGPVVAMVCEGPRAVESARALIGATDPRKAAPGTIRGDLGADVQRNLVHASDSASSAEFEIGLFFPDELVAGDMEVGAGT